MMNPGTTVVNYQYSPQVTSMGSANLTSVNAASNNVNHRYQINNVSALTAPANMSLNNTIPNFPMSPGGSLGLGVAANVAQQQQQQQQVHYQQQPPPNSTPMLNTNAHTANIHTILGGGGQMNAPMHSMPQMNVNQYMNNMNQ